MLCLQKRIRHISENIGQNEEQSITPDLENIGQNKDKKNETSPRR